MEQLVLRPSSIVLRLCGGFAIVFAVIAAVLLEGGRLVGLVPLVLAILSAFGWATSVIPGVAYLRLDERGYELKSLRHRFRIDWAEVTGFTDVWIATGGRYKAHVVEARFGEGFAERHAPTHFREGMLGIDERYLPASYGNKSAPELAALLEQWRVAHS